MQKLLAWVWWYFNLTTLHWSELLIMCLWSTTATYPQLHKVPCLAVEFDLDVSHQHCVTLVLHHLPQAFLVALPWESREQWCQLYDGKSIGSDKVTAGCQTHRLLLGTILEMLNCLTCHITHYAESTVTFPLRMAFAVCFKVDKTAILHESYFGSVTSIPWPFSLHCVYWTWPLIVWILPGAKQQASVQLGRMGTGELFCVRGQG